MTDQDGITAANNVIPFRPRPGPEQMVREVEAALRRMWQRAAEEALPDRIVHLLDVLERREVEAGAHTAPGQGSDGRTLAPANHV